MLAVNLADYLDGASQAASLLTAVHPLAGVIASLLHIGADLARAGKDPVTHITRLIDLDFAAQSREADEAEARKFGAP